MIVVIIVKYTTKKSSSFGSSPKRNELVFYHADFCGYCHQFMPVFDQTAPELRKMFPGLTITKLQHEKDQLAIHKAKPPVEGYPTLRLNGAEFAGPRTAEGLMMFVRQNYYRSG
jgi:thiol-disulfide isomerase/thioredoxin